MSRRFMILMLVVFGGLLYATSLALQKHTEPPPPPSAQDNAEMKRQQEQEYKMRMQQMEHLKKEAASAAKEAKKNQGKGIKGAPGKLKDQLHLPVPEADPRKPKTRSPNDIVIGWDWFKNHPDGEKGIAQEIEHRKKNAKPAPKMQLRPVAPEGMEQQDMKSHKAPAGDGHNHKPGDGHNHKPGDGHNH